MNRSAFSPVGTTIACATLLLLGGTRLAAQEEGGSVQPPGPVVTVDGRASISVEAWHSEAEEGIPDDSVARRPPLFTRIELAPEFHIGQVSIPLRLGLSIGNDGGSEPVGGKGSGGFLDPANSLGISPDFGWLRLHIGSHTPEVSELAGSERKLFGGGLELTLDSLELRASWGVSNPARKRDTTGGWESSQYEERMATGRVSYGLGVGRIGLNVIHAKEDSTSIEAVDSTVVGTELPEGRPMPPAHETAMLSLDGRLRFGRLSLVTELAGSYFVGDLSAPPIDSLDHDPAFDTPIAVAEALGLSPRAFTLFDVAGRLTGRLGLGRGERIDVEIAYTGPNFHSPGRPDLPGDRLRVAIAPRLSTADRALTFTGRVAWERLNLFRPYDPRSDRWKGSLDLLWSDAFGREGLSLGGGYRLYRSGTSFTDTSSGLPEDAIDRLADTSYLHTVQFTPTHVLRSTGAVHVVGSMLSYTTGSGGSGAGRLRRQGFAATGIYTLSLTGSVPLSLNTSATWTHYELSTDTATLGIGSGSIPASSYSTLSGTASLGYRFSRPGRNELSGRVSLSRSAGIDGGTTSPVASSHTSLGLLGRWRPTTQLLLHLELRRSRFDFIDRIDREEITGRIGVEWLFG